MSGKVRYPAWVGATLAASCITLLPTEASIDSGRVEKPESSVMASVLREREREADLMAAEFAKHDARNPAIIRPLLEEDGIDSKKWLDTCRECEWLESEEGQRLYDRARKYDVQEVVYGLPGVESGMRQFDRNGDTIESDKGAMGKMQVVGRVGKDRTGKPRRPGGFDEVLRIYKELEKLENNEKPDPRHEGFVKRYMEPLKEDARLFGGTRKDAWESLLRDEEANEAAGIIYLGFLKHMYKSMSIALEMYNAGEGGRAHFPDDAREYRKAVFKRQGKWDNLIANECPEIDRKIRDYGKRFHPQYKDAFIAYRARNPIGR